jgi:hypothetical protein
MADDADNRVLEHLRQIRTVLEGLRADLEGLRADMRDGWLRRNDRL